MNFTTTDTVQSVLRRSGASIEMIVGRRECNAVVGAQPVLDTRGPLSAACGHTYSGQLMVGRDRPTNIFALSRLHNRPTAARNGFWQSLECLTERSHTRWSASIKSRLPFPPVPAVPVLPTTHAWRVGNRLSYSAPNMACCGRLFC